MLAMRFGFFGGVVDLGRAVADRSDEVRGGSDVLGHLAGGLVLLGHRAVDVFEHRADRLDRQRNPVHRLYRSGGVALQRVDFLLDLLGRILGLHRKRLDLGSDHREAAPGSACACRLDRRVERQQRRLPGDLRDQVDDIADRGGRFLEPVDIEARVMGGRARFVRELAGVADLRSDAFGGIGELAGGLREGGRGALGFARAQAERIGALADGGQAWRPWPPRRRQRNSPRAPAGESCRQARFQAVREFAWLDSASELSATSATTAGFASASAARRGEFGRGFSEQSNGHSVSRPRV